jgi:hypothetical protein
VIDELVPGFIVDDSVLWLTTPATTARVDLLLDGDLVVSRSTAEVPLPEGRTEVAPNVAVFEIGDPTPWVYEVVARDASGAVIAEVDLATWFGGGDTGDGEEGSLIPGTR